MLDFLAIKYKHVKKTKSFLKSKTFTMSNKLSWAIGITLCGMYGSNLLNPIKSSDQ